MFPRSVLCLIVSVFLFAAYTVNTHIDMGKYSPFKRKQQLAEIHSHHNQTLKTQTVTCSVCEKTCLNHAGMAGHMSSQHKHVWMEQQESTCS
jgi:hypothetical protein